MATRALHELETAAEWRAAEVADPEAWTVRLRASDHAELDHALVTAKRKSTDPLDLDREDFPLDGLATTLAEVVDVLLDGRGFVRIAALDASRYGDDDLTLLYWGIGLHLGEPWAQNKHGHVLGDVTDQGKTIDDPTVRGNELGADRARLPHRRVGPRRPALPALGAHGRAFVCGQRSRDPQPARPRAPRAGRGALRSDAL